VADFARLLSPEHAFLPISGGAMLLTVWLAVRLRDSQIGRAMIAVRDDEIAAASVGIDVARTKMTAFVLSGLCGALSGALFAHYTGFISPSDFAASQSILFLMMLVVGGEGAVIGAIFGALALTFLPELMRDAATGYIKLGGDEKAMITRLLKDGYLIIYGAITLLVLMVMPKGIAGLLSRWFGVDRWA
jgi:branched-chain amino acid transport system permease protein